MQSCAKRRIILVQDFEAKEMKIKLHIHAILFFALCGLVTTATSTSYWLVENAPSFYQWSFYALVMWYAYILYRSKNVNNYGIVRKNNIVLRNVFFFTVLFLALLIILLSNAVGLPLQGLTFLGCIMFMHINTQSSLTELEVRGFLLCGTVGAVVFALAFARLAGIWYGSTQTISGFNPQSVGCWAGIYFCAVMLGITKTNPTWYWRVVGYTLCGYLFYITLATETRTATIVLVLLITLKILPRIKLLGHPITAGVVAIMPMLITYTSIWLFEMGLQDVSGTSVLNGREQLWINCLKAADQHPILGNYIIGNTIYTHNLYVEHTLLFGYVMAALFMLMTFWTLKKTVANIQTPLQYDAFLAFAGMVLMSSQENMIFSTGCGGAFVYAYSFLLISTSQETHAHKCAGQRRTQKFIKGEV